VAEEYHQLKKRLATRFGSDREGYTGAKTTFIESIISQAVAELNARKEADEHNMP